MIIWGFRSLNKVLGQVQYVCQQCKQNSFHTVVRSRRWFTLFFIPIFPFTKSSISRCNICGIQTRMDNARADQLFSNQPTPKTEPTNQPPQWQQPAPGQQQTPPPQGAAQPPYQGYQAQAPGQMPPPGWTPPQPQGPFHPQD